MMIQAVVFDLGEVLASPPLLFTKLAARIGITPDRLESLYWRDRDAYDAGASASHYWAPILEAAGGRPDDRTSLKLAEADAAAWSEIRPAAWQLLRDCSTAGATVVVLSNSPHAMQTAADRAPWRAEVDHLFISATMGLMKPDPEIFAAVADHLNLTGSQIAFIDDKQKNVDVALIADWNAHLWVDDKDTRSWLVEMGIL